MVPEAAVRLISDKIMRSPLPPFLFAQRNKAHFPDLLCQSRMSVPHAWRRLSAFACIDPDFKVNHV